MNSNSTRRNSMRLPSPWRQSCVQATKIEKNKPDSCSFIRRTVHYGHCLSIPIMLPYGWQKLSGPGKKPGNKGIMFIFEGFDSLIFTVDKEHPMHWEYLPSTSSNQDLNAPFFSTKDQRRHRTFWRMRTHLEILHLSLENLMANQRNISNNGEHH